MAYGDINTTTVTIANGASLSDAASVKWQGVVGVVIPGAWTPAGVGFHVSYDGGTTYVQLMKVDPATAPFGLDEYELLAADVPTGESVLIPLDPVQFMGCTHVKVRSQTAGAAVNQGAARSVVLVTRLVGA